MDSLLDLLRAPPRDQSHEPHNLRTKPDPKSGHKPSLGAPETKPENEDLRKPPPPGSKSRRRQSLLSLCLPETKLKLPDDITTPSSPHDRALTPVTEPPLRS
ncbi:hypothetical protein YC2023_000155 [Brassica napus]